MFSAQPWHCNCCGQAMNSPPGGAMGREFRCCSLECVREMNWRQTLSIMNKPYRPDPETPLGKRVAEMEAEAAALASETERGR